MARSLRLTCFHGFLGRPVDWDFLAPALADRGTPVAIEAPDLWARSGVAFDELSGDLAREYRDADVLIGYSMGGRLATMTFFRPECRARALVVISSHPGGLDEATRRERREANRRWADRFLTEEWTGLISAWDFLGVFSSDPPGTAATRREEDYDRRALAHALTEWSVADQPDLRIPLRVPGRPVLWLAGSRDVKYASIARAVRRFGDHTTVRVITGAGHRLLRHAADGVADHLAAFLKERVPPAEAAP